MIKAVMHFCAWLLWYISESAIQVTEEGEKIKD